MGTLKRLGREVLRRSWIVVLCVVVATGVAALVGGKGRSVYVANATLLVPSGKAAAADPGRATEAQRLAASYAGVIGDDSKLATAVGDAMGLPPTEARNRITVTNRANTAVLDVRVTGDSAATSGAGLRALVQGLTADPPASDAITPGTLVASQQSAEGTRVGGELRPPVLGAALGLVLGVIAAIALARADRRADRVDDLLPYVPCPITEVREVDDAGSTAELGAVVQRWDQVLTARDVVLLPVGRAAEGDAWRVLTRLTRAAQAVEVPVSAAVAGDAPAGRSNPPGEDTDEIDLAGLGASTRARTGRTAAGAGAGDGSARLLVHDRDRPSGNGAVNGGAATRTDENGAPGRDRLLISAAPPAPTGLPRAMDAGHVVLVARQSDRITAIAGAQVELANFGLHPAWLLLVQH